MSFGSSPAKILPPPPVAPPPTIDVATAKAREEADSFRRRRGTQANIKTASTDATVTTAAARLLGS